MTTDTNKAFINWHLTDASETCKRRFELGDIILDACAATGQKPCKTLERLMRLVTGYDRSLNYYLDAVQMVQTLTKNQREALIECRVPVSVCGKLCRAKYNEGNLRSRYISEIKSGKIEAPWTPIVGRVGSSKGGTKRMDHGGDDVDSGNNPNNIFVAKPTGDFERDVELIENVLKSLKSRFGSDKYVEAVKRVK